MTLTGSLTNRNINQTILAVIGVSIIVAGWYLIQIQKDRLDFSIPDIEGNTVTLSDYSDEVVVLDFMAT